MSNIILPGLDDIVNEIEVSVRGHRGQAQNQAISFFDLVRSSAITTEQGDEAGSQSARNFVGVTAKIVNLFDGKVVRTFGDGVLCRFDDPTKACWAALNVRAALEHTKLNMTCGLTFGRVTVFPHPDGENITGSGVDRCARVQELAWPGQILMDRAMYDMTQPHVIERDECSISHSMEATVKGGVRLEVYELSTFDYPPVGTVKTPFQIHSGGRLSIHEKVEFVSNARDEVIEIGIGLTSFAKYFTGQKPEEWRDPIRRLLQRGVNVRCYGLDPRYLPGREYLAEQGDDSYEQELHRAKRAILEERQECRRRRYPGTLEYYQYRRIPVFHCLGVDIEDTYGNGRVLLSPYLPGMSRAEAPVHQVSSASHPELYAKYLDAIRVFQRNSAEVVRLGGDQEIP